MHINNINHMTGNQQSCKITRSAGTPHRSLWFNSAWRYLHEFTCVHWRRSDRLSRLVRCLAANRANLVFACWRSAENSWLRFSRWCRKRLVQQDKVFIGIVAKRITQLQIELTQNKRFILKMQLNGRELYKWLLTNPPNSSDEVHRLCKFIALVL